MINTIKLGGKFVTRGTSRMRFQTRAGRKMFLVVGVMVILIWEKEMVVEGRAAVPENFEVGANASIMLMSANVSTTGDKGWNAPPAVDDLLEEPAVRHLRSYMRIRTDHPHPEGGYRQAVMFFHVMAAEIGLEFKAVDLGPGNLFAVIITWPGRDPSLKSVLFNGHMDVVPTEPEFWTYPPFEAVKDAKGNIYGRGASDMKSATIATLEAIRNLKKTGFSPLRTIHVTILPDEETGGLTGMKPFVASQDFKDLNVGIDIDEGGTNPTTDSMVVGYAEKSTWQFKVTAFGQEAHGSTFPQYSAGQRLQLVTDKLAAFRLQQYLKLQSGQTIDKVTTVNLVKLGGGVAANVIPAKMWAEFDMRLRRTDYSFSEVEHMLQTIVQEAASLGNSTNPNQVILNFSLKTEETGATVANSSNIWWNVVQGACQEMNISCVPFFAPPVSDSRFVRSAGIPSFGFGPFLNTPRMAHITNEYINEQEYLRGIVRYQVLIRHLSMQPPSFSTEDNEAYLKYTYNIN